MVRVICSEQRAVIGHLERTREQIQQRTQGPRTLFVTGPEIVWNADWGLAGLQTPREVKTTIKPSKRAG
jgi:hypothetical protein